MKNRGGARNIFYTKYQPPHPTMLGIPRGSRADNALRVNKVTNAAAVRLENTKTKVTNVTSKGVDGKSTAPPSTITVKGIDYRTGKRRTIRIKSKIMQRMIGIQPASTSQPAL